MRTSTSKILTICSLGLMLTAAAHAGVIYSAPPDQSGASDMNSFLEADDFAVGSLATIQQITFWALESVVGDYTGSIAWSINSDASGVPGGAVAAGSATPSGTATGQTAAGFNEYSYSFAVSVPLTAGTYWLTLHNGPTNTLPSTDFFWEWSNGNAGNSQSQDLSVAGQPWTSNFAELAFKLDGTAAPTTPEPSSILLMAAGLLALPFARRRRNE